MKDRKLKFHPYIIKGCNLKHPETEETETFYVSMIILDELLHAAGNRSYFSVFIIFQKRRWAFPASIEGLTMFCAMS